MVSTRRWFQPPAVGCVCARCGQVYFAFEWKPPFICTRCEAGRKRAEDLDRFLAMQRKLRGVA